MPVKTTCHVMSDAPHATPLRWPAERPRTAAGERQTLVSNTGARPPSFMFAIWRLRHALQQIAATEILITSDVKLNRESHAYLEAPPPADPGVSVTFEVAGRHHTLACDKFLTATENLIAIGRHVQAIRTAERFGVASALDSLAAFHSEPPASPKPWREVLGDLERAEDVEAAFRRLAVERHPDKATGSHDAMAELSRARAEALEELASLRQALRRPVPWSEIDEFVFTGDKDFAAMRSAEDFLEKRGFSVGLNERGAPRAVMLGGPPLPRWSDYSGEERTHLDGCMWGDMRKGPVTVTLRRTADSQEPQQAWEDSSPTLLRARATKLYGRTRHKILP